MESKQRKREKVTRQIGDTIEIKDPTRQLEEMGEVFRQVPQNFEKKRRGWEQLSLLLYYYTMYLDITLSLAPSIRYPNI